MAYPIRPAFPSPFLKPTEQIIAQLAGHRPIWSLYYGHGQLIGQVGHPPAFAHVAEYPQLPAAHRIRPAHTAAFFILN